MVRWLSKFVLDILPSVAATIIGAYIVNHYIVPKSPTGSPAAAMATTDPKGDGKTDSLPADASADKPAMEKTSVEKNLFEKGVAEKAAIERTAEKAAADITGTTDRRHRPTKSVVEKPAPKPQAPTAAVAAIDPVPAQAIDDRRDVNELARAAIDRLRPQETARPAAERPQDAARALATPAPPSMQPLPPPIMVSTPNAEVFNSGAGASIAPPPRGPAARNDESRRLSPPGDIPGATASSRPLDLHADSGNVASGRTSVADDVVSAAKSVFHAVLPH